MNHFYHDISGWFDYEDLYAAQVRAAAPNARFVEVGAWLGKSTAFLAVEIINSGKAIRLNVVDTWQGTPGNAEHESLKAENGGDLFAAWERNMQPVAGKLGLVPVRSCSVEAAALYAQLILDFVFLDGDHAREAVAADLRAWYPKVRAGGTIAGHDFTHHWPGVCAAVLEFFNGRPVDVRGSCWIHRKAEA